MELFSNNGDRGMSDEIEALRRQVAALARSVAASGKDLRRSARHERDEIYDTLAGWLASALPVARLGARRFERTIKDDPARTIAVSGLVALGVVAAIVFSTRKR